MFYFLSLLVQIILLFLHNKEFPSFSSMVVPRSGKLCGSSIVEGANAVVWWSGGSACCHALGLEGVHVYSHAIIPSLDTPSRVHKCVQVVRVMTPPMVGPTWPRVRSTLGSDCLPTLSQGTASLRLAYGLTSYCLHCYRAHPMSRDWGCTSTYC